MKNLVLYSSLHYNNEVAEFLMENVKNKDVPKIGIIPSNTIFNHKILERYTDCFKILGFKEFIEFDVGYRFDCDKLVELLRCDAIFLSGGNTFLFMYLLKLRGMIEPLREFVANGGILIGESAGSIIMGEDILIAYFADENYIGEDALEGLDLVPFKIKPHWGETWAQYIDDFMRYQQACNTDIFLLKETDVIIVNDNGVRFVGTPLMITEGVLLGDETSKE